MLGQVRSGLGVARHARLEHCWHAPHLGFVAGAHDHKNFIREAQRYGDALHGHLFVALGIGHSQRHAGGGNDFVDDFLQRGGIFHCHHQATGHGGFAKFFGGCRNIHEHMRRLGDVQPARGGVFENGNRQLVINLFHELLE